MRLPRDGLARTGTTARCAGAPKPAPGQTGLDFEGDGTGESLVKVSLESFHGIEVNDFACCVARTALWIERHDSARRMRA